MTQVVLANAPKYATEITTGLEWVTASAKEFKVQKKRLSAGGFAFLTLAGTNPANKEMVNYGQIEKAWLPKEGRSVSLAAWFAHTFKSGTVFAVERVDEGKDGGEPRYWFCATIDGQVLTGTDVVDNWDTILYLVQSNLEVLDDPGIGYIGKDAALLPGRSGQEEPPALAEVLNKGAYRKALLSPAVQSKTPLILASTLIAVSFIGGGGYWWYHKQAEAQQAAARAAAAQQNQIARAQKQYQEILAEIAGLSHAGRTLNAMWFDALNTTPTAIGGWALDVFECESSQCTFTYMNRDLTLPAELKARLGTICDELTIGIEGLEAQCVREYESQPLIAQADDSAQPDEPSIVRVALDEAGVDRLQADLMTVGRFGSGASYAINEPIKYPFPGSRFLPTSRLFNQGQWGLTFNIKYYQSILNGLNRYPGLSIDRLEGTWGSQVVALSGQYLTVDSPESGQ